MGLLDFVAKPGQRVAYLFPELQAEDSPIHAADVGDKEAPAGGYRPTGQLQNVFIFQFWPKQLQDTYTPNYASKNIPGGSHPLLQWTSGNGRDLSFTAEFVSELTEDGNLVTDKNADFRARISTSSAKSSITAVGAGAGALGTTGLGSLLLPSSRYTVNVKAALAALQQYLYPNYISNDTGTVAKPPKKLILVLPGTGLGRGELDDGILCVLRSAPVTIESWFPGGDIRSASVSLRFSEIVQRSAGGGNVSNIKYIGAQAYKALASKYTSTLNSPSELRLR